MLRPSMPLRAAILLATCLLLLLYSVDAVWSTSVDMPHHYALIARLAEFGVLPPALDLSLGEMSIYPWFSHAVAAGVGRLLHSNMLGLQVVTLTSIIALWAAFVYIVQSLPRRAALAGSAIAAVLLTVNHLHLRIALHGDEVNGNFFFAQLAAQALVAAIVCAAVYAERTAIASWKKYIVLAALVPLVAGVHLLPAVELLGVLAALVALDVLANWFDARPTRLTVRAAGAGAAIVAAATLAVLLHPSYKAMKLIAENNGGLSFIHVPDNRYIGAYCAIILAFSAVFLWRWLNVAGERRGAYGALKYLGVYGIAVAGLCLLQLILLQAGIGSAYAVKKYLFAIDTIFLLDLALLPALLPERIVGALPARSWLRHRAVAYFAAPALIVLAFLAVTPWQKVLSTARLVALEQDVIALRDHVLKPVPGKSDFVGALPGMPAPIAYMYSIGLLKSPRDARAYEILGGKAVSDLSAVGNLIAALDAPAYDMPACRRLSTRDAMAVLDPSCVARLRAEKADCRGVFDFSKAAAINADMIEGFSAAEPHGSWTDGTNAAFTCTAPKTGAAPHAAVVDMHAFVDATHGQRVLASINGGAPLAIVFAPGEGAPRTVRLALPQDGGGKLRIAFSLPDAVSPMQLGMSADGRRLAIGIRSIAFE